MDENPLYKGKGNLTKSIRVRLVSAVRCAIRMRSQPNVKNAAKLLEKDIKNSVHHIFGNHTNCSKDFCKAKQGEGKLSEVNMEENEKEDNDIMEEQINMWNEGSSIEDIEESRYGANNTCNNPKIIKDVSIILNSLKI